MARDCPHYTNLARMLVDGYMYMLAQTDGERTRQMAQRKEVDSAESPERGVSQGEVSAVQAAAPEAASDGCDSATSICIVSPTKKEAGCQR
jgi:hypothetical protein